MYTDTEKQIMNSLTDEVFESEYADGKVFCCEYEIYAQLKESLEVFYDRLKKLTNQINYLWNVTKQQNLEDIQKTIGHIKTTGFYLGLDSGILCAKAKLALKNIEEIENGIL